MVISHKDRTIIDLEEYAMPVLALLRRAGMISNARGC